MTPTQLLHESNSIVHVTEHEGNPHRRPLTYDEIHALFDAADARVEQIRAHHRKGVTAAMRDAALLKTIYAFGIRRREAWGLDLADLRHNPTVRPVRPVRCAVRALGQVLPRQPTETPHGFSPSRRWTGSCPCSNSGAARYGRASAPTVIRRWVTERADRMSLRRINDAFTAARAAGLDPSLDLHFLRHS